MDPIEIAMQAYVDYLTANAQPDLPADPELALAAARQAAEALAAAGQVPAAQVLSEWADRIARAARNRLHRDTRRLILRVAAGELPLGDLCDDVPVPLGEAGETLYGLLNARTLPFVDRERYTNVQDAVRQYDVWRDGMYDPLLPVVVASGLTYRDAYRQGLLWRS